MPTDTSFSISSTERWHQPPFRRIEAGGIRTPTVQIKSLLCCRYTTTPYGLAYRFPTLHGHFTSPIAQFFYRPWPSSGLLGQRPGLIAREGVEPSFPPYQSGVLNRWTTGLTSSVWACGSRMCAQLLARLPKAQGGTCRSRDGRNRTDDLVFPRHVGCHCPTSRSSSVTLECNLGERPQPANRLEDYRPRPCSGLIGRRPRSRFTFKLCLTLQPWRTPSVCEQS